MSFIAYNIFTGRYFVFFFLYSVYIFFFSLSHVRSIPPPPHTHSLVAKPRFGGSGRESPRLFRRKKSLLTGQGHFRGTSDFSWGQCPPVPLPGSAPGTLRRACQQLSLVFVFTSPSSSRVTASPGFSQFLT